jgi:DEAD/DEAH box helicase domain-containing protein
MIFLDIETQNDWTGGQNFSIPDYKISYIGVIDDSGKEYDFWEKDIAKLEPLLKSADLVVGYNSIGFDIPIIGNYLGRDINDIPQLDLMVAVYKKLGFRPKLDSLVTATLGVGKIGSGADAIRYFASGQLDKLKEYCMEDVRLTKRLYEFGRDNGYIKYFDKSGFAKDLQIDWNLGKKVKEKDAGTISMFN